MEFILASGSPRRKELLELAGLSFQVKVSHVEEIIEPGLSPKEQVKSLALQKADSVASEFPQRVVLGADTIVVLENKILGKPIDEADAFAMLKSLVGKKHQVMTAVAIVCHEKKLQQVFVNTTEVSFYEMTDEWIKGYVKSGQPMDKAGSYGIQDLGFELVEKINGDYYSVMGLPIAQLKRELKGLGLL